MNKEEFVYPYKKSGKTYNKLKEMAEEISNLQKELDKKDKVIDELINFILRKDIDEDYCYIIPDEECDEFTEGYCDKCIKKHFFKKVEEENE